MTFIKTNYHSSIKLENSVYNNLNESENPSFLKKQIGGRFCYLALTPFSAITSIADTVIGIGAGIGTIATLGTNPKIFNTSISYISSSRYIIAKPYINILRTINPNAKFFEFDPDKQKSSISPTDDGLLTGEVQRFLELKALDASTSNNFLKRHVISRLTYALLAISSIVTRYVDGIIGVSAAVLSIAFLGTVEPLNNLAYRGLQSTGIISDLFYCTAKFINPWATNQSNLGEILVKDPF